MSAHKWTIHGEPIGKGRHRIAMRGGFPHAYTPPRTAQWEALAVERLCCGWDGPPSDAPAVLDVRAIFTRPKRLMRASDPDGRILRTSRPDFDNVGKAVADALQKAGVLRDDAQIWDGRCRKFYAAKDEGPCVEVELTIEDSDFGPPHKDGPKATGDARASSPSLSVVRGV